VLVFADLMVQLIERSGLDQQRFAKKAGVSAAYVSMVITGKRKPNWKHGDRWADLLDLSGLERERFLDAMQFAATPPRIQRLVLILEQGPSLRRQ
jgi:transcriptional regulator with XRE-family HTH domain